ncbi:MAG: HEAT repeat domain-containing protein [Xylanivirga thermophila]|jgi:HEAT repeat protein|uniref:HEAT repeat domain-containing protein n=1 Tax=Xylanivirga thermophila TaxID=2496273 RepID=UPI0039F4F769
MFGVSLKKIESWEQKGKTNKLLEATTNSNKDIRLAAIRALGSSKDLDIANKLITMLRDADPEIRIEIMKTLGKIGNPIASEHIRSFTTDEDENVRKVASEVLKTLPHKD